MTDTRTRPPWSNLAANDPGWGPPPPPPWVPPGPEPGPPAPSRPPVGLQNLLLGLGTALVAIAAVVFTAVNWSQLDAAAQALVLVAVTVAAGVAAAAAVRRAMPATAEALATVAVLLALVDVHAFRVGLAPSADPRLFWAGGSAVEAALAAAMARATSIRSPQIAAGLLAQVPLLCVLARTGSTVWAAQLAVVAQAFAVLLVVEHVAVGTWTRRAASAWAVGVAALLTAATVFDSVVGALLGDRTTDLHRGTTALSLVAAALLAGFVAWIRSESDEIRPLALFATSSLVLGAVWFGAVEPFGADTAVGLVALIASLIVLGARRLPAVWGDVPACTAGVVGMLAVLPLLGAMASMMVASSEVSSATWQRSGSQAAAALQLADAPSYGSAGLALQLLAVAIGVLALVRRGSRLGLTSAASVLAICTLMLSPLLVPLTIAATVALALAAVVAGSILSVVVGGRSRAFPLAVGFAGVAYLWATAWSLATPGLTFAALAVGIAAAAAIAVVGRRDEIVEAAAGGAAWVVAALPILAGLVALDAGTSAAMAWALAACVAAAVSIAGVVLLDPRGAASDISRVMREAVEATALAAYGAALLGTVTHGDADAVSVVLAAGVLGFGLHAVRPGRMHLGLLAGAELLALVWLRLGQAEVATVEAYTLPLALLLLGVGLVGARLERPEGREPGSWITFGPALVVGLAPTVWLTFTANGSVRPLVGLVVGALVLVGGVAWGKRAMVDVGTATVVALGLHQLAPVVGEIPNWATIGATGVALIVVGATFEQRRRDLKAVLRRYSALT